MVLNTDIPVLRKFWLKTYKKSHLERVRFRAQSQYFQATFPNFRPYSWDMHSSQLIFKFSALKVQK
jgi:hypothetical protein